MCIYSSDLLRLLGDFIGLLALSRLIGVEAILSHWVSYIYIYIGVVFYYLLDALAILAGLSNTYRCSL